MLHGHRSHPPESSATMLTPFNDSENTFIQRPTPPIAEVLYRSSFCMIYSPCFLVSLGYNRFSNTMLTPFNDSKNTFIKRHTPPMADVLCQSPFSRITICVVEVVCEAASISMAKSQYFRETVSGASGPLEGYDIRSLVEYHRYVLPQLGKQSIPSGRIVFL